MAEMLFFATSLSLALPPHFQCFIRYRLGCFFVEQFRVRKCVNDIPVNPALFHEVSINPVHIRIGRRQSEWLLFLFLFLLLRIDSRYPNIRTKQKPDC